MKTEGGIAEFSVLNIAGIETARLRILGRFIAVTGESGAGKSSLVRALEFLAGKRAQTSSIRHGSEEGEVWGQFIDGTEASETLAGRVISRSGRNRNYLGEQSVPFSRLRDFAEKRIGIQSQFSQLDLLEPRRQRDLLDSCGKEEAFSLRTRLSRDFEKAIRMERDLASLQEKRRHVEKNFQDAETILETARGLRLNEGNEAEWRNELSALEGFLAHRRKLHEFASRFLGGISGQGMGDEMQQWARTMAELVPQAEKDTLAPSFENFLKGLQEMENLSRVVLSKESLADAEERRDFLEYRLGTLKKLKRLARVETFEELAAYCDQAEEKLRWVQASSAEVESLQGSCREARKNVWETAMALRERRRHWGMDLEKKVTAHLADLAMESFRFGVELRDLGKIRPTGADEVEFTLSSGGQKGSVIDVASGGELSRILLALQVSLPDGQLPGTLVFDEVEAGLGGRSALLSGFKLRELSGRCQVILVTHEAVIAAQADQHFVVRRDGETTTVSEVTGESRAIEIARMLSGDPDSPKALDHAFALLAGKG